MAASLASAPELQKNTCPPPPSSSSMAIAVSVATGVGEQVGDVEQRAGLLGEGLGHGRVGVAERGHRQAAEEVEVARALGRPTARCPARARTSPAAGRRPASTGRRRGPPWRRRARSRPHLRGRRLGAASGVAVGPRVTMVPMPASVKSSSSSTWGTRPSRMWARPHAAAHGVRRRPRSWGSCRPTACRRPRGASQLGGRGLADQAGGVVDVAAQALDVGEVHELLGRRAPRRWRRPRCRR